VLVGILIQRSHEGRSGLFLHTLGDNLVKAIVSRDLINKIESVLSVCTLRVFRIFEWLIDVIFIIVLQLFP
jgi:hypothetical protein